MLSSPLKIGVIATNETGLSCASVMAQRHEVVLYDDNRLAVHSVNAGLSPVNEPALRRHLGRFDLNLRATFLLDDALDGADLVVVATPTRFDPHTQTVDTSALDRTLRRVQSLNPSALTVIESTCPVGYTRMRAQNLCFHNIMAAPAFLRPQRALEDRLFPRRFIVGDQGERGHAYARLLQDCARLPHVPVLLTGSAEAEAIHLFDLRKLVSGQPATAEQVTQYAREHRLNAGQLHQGLDIPDSAQLNPTTPFAP